MSNADVLTKWLQDNKYSKQAFADMIGATRSTVSRICHGKSIPSSQRKLLIQRITAGAVSVEGWQ